MNRELKKIKFLLEYGIHPDCKLTNFSVGYFRPLIHIITDNRKHGDDNEIVKLLLDHGASINEPLYVNPLSMALRYKKYKICKTLINYGADIDICLEIRPIDVKTFKPTDFNLYRFIKSENLVLLKKLIKNTSPRTMKKEYFFIPVIYSLIEKREKEIKIFIRYGFRLVYTAVVTFLNYYSFIRDTRFGDRYIKTEWYKFGQKLELEVKKEVLDECKVLNMIFLSNIHDENSYFYILPLDVLKVIISIAGLVYPSFSRLYKDINKVSNNNRENFFTPKYKKLKVEK
jgi:hypothetical protein